MMEQMMRQLLSKDVLYEPLVDLSSKYPAWLAANKPKISQTQYESYSKQLEYCRECIRLYDECPDAVDRITDMMHKMQECGSPPKEILEQLAPGLDFDSIDGDKDGSSSMPNLDALLSSGASGDGQCPVQ